MILVLHKAPGTVLSRDSGPPQGFRYSSIRDPCPCRRLLVQFCPMILVFRKAPGLLLHCWNAWSLQLVLVTSDSSARYNAALWDIWLFSPLPECLTAQLITILLCGMSELFSLSTGFQEFSSQKKSIPPDHRVSQSSPGLHCLVFVVSFMDGEQHPEGFGNVN